MKFFLHLRCIRTYKVFILIILCSRSFSGQLYSQVIPPGGIGNTSNIILWLSPDTALYNNSGTVASIGEDILQWHDISTNSFIFTNTDATRRPVLTTYNGQNFLDFTPGDFLENTIIQNLINGLNEFSIFVVVKSDVTNTDNGFLDSENPNDDDDKICLRYDVNGANTGRVNVIKSGLSGNSPDNQIETTGNIQTTNIQVITITWKSGEKLKSYINGVANELSVNNVVGPISNIVKIIVGKGPKDGGANEGWDGRIGTVIFYNYQFPADTIAIISSGASLTAGTIGTNQTICSGTAPSTLTNIALPTGGTGTYNYQWQYSLNNSVWTNIGGATSSTYSPGALTTNTYYRRRVTSGTNTVSSPSILITVNPILPVSVSITSTASAFCSGASVTFTATPVNGGATPSYQWKRNGVNVGANNSNYTTTTLGNNNDVSCVLISNAACIIGNPATSNTITVTVINGAGSWSGITSTNWNTNSNWCSGARPVAATNVTINGGVFNNPRISTNAAVCNNLTLSSGAILSVDGNTLTVNGNLTINSGANLEINSSTVTVLGSIIINAGGTLTINSPGAVSARGTINHNGTISGTGTLTLNGTTVQNINGAGGAAISNLTLNNAAGCNVNSSITISGTLTLATGQLRSNGNVTIDLNSGSISGAGVGTVAGNIIVQKTAYASRYHYLSSPLMNGMTVADWNDDRTINFGQYANLYYYDETLPSPLDVVGWKPVNSLTDPLTPLKGYALFFNSPVTIDQTGTYTHGAVPANVTLSNTVSSDLAVDGWNLVGNPYPSTLDWEAASGWTKTGIDNAVYFWDPVNDRYASYVTGSGTNGGTRYIPSMQAFWVRVTASGGTGTFGVNNNARITSPNPQLWKLASENNILKLTASTGIYSDETVIRLREDAVESFDEQLDAYKLTNEGNTPNLFTIIGNDKYSVNSLPDTSTDITIPLHLKASLAGAYTLHAEEAGAFDNSYEIVIEDKLLDYDQDLRADPTYMFQVNSGDITDRFVIHVRKANLNPVNNQQTESTVKIRSLESTLSIDFINISSNSGDITVYDLLGHPIAGVRNADISSGNYSIDFSYGNGLYMVKVAVKEEVFVQKVYLK